MTQGQSWELSAQSLECEIVTVLLQIQEPLLPHSSFPWASCYMGTVTGAPFPGSFSYKVDPMRPLEPKIPINSCNYQNPVHNAP